MQHTIDKIGALSYDSKLAAQEIIEFSEKLNCGCANTVCRDNINSSSPNIGVCRKDLANCSLRIPIEEAAQSKGSGQNGSGEAPQPTKV